MQFTGFQKGANRINILALDLCRIFATIYQNRWFQSVFWNNYNYS